MPPPPAGPGAGIAAPRPAPLGGRAGAVTSFLLVGAGSLVLNLPSVLARWIFTPDAIGYVGVAHDWLYGQGFVDPILYAHYLRGVHPPVPALAIRPPVFSWLLAIPMALGAGWTELAVVHVVWASLVGAAAVLVGRRLLSPPSALAFGIAVAWAGSWGEAATQLLSGATAIGMLLLLIAAAPWALRTVGRGALLGALLALAWLTRPNLPVVLPAIALAAAVELGPRQALRSRPLWACILSFVVLEQAISLAVFRTTGLAPYAHYGLMAQMIGIGGIYAYRHEWTGVWPFLHAHWREVLATIATNIRMLIDYACARPFYMRVGWIAVPGIAYGLLRSGPGSFRRRVAALAALGFLLTAIAVTAGFVPGRYPLPGIVCAWLVSLALLDELVHRLRRRLPTPRAQRLAVFAPLAAVLVLWTADNAVPWQRAARAQLGSYLRYGTRRATSPLDRAARDLCPEMDRNAIVSSPDPWRVYLWCGNAGLLAPWDLDDASWVARYLDEQAPGYVIVDRRPAYRVLAASPRLEAVARSGPWVLYRVVDPSPRSRPWRAPPPLAGGGAWSP